MGDQLVPVGPRDPHGQKASLRPIGYLSVRHPRSRRDFFRLAGITTAGGSAVFIAACDDEDEDGAEPAKRGGGTADLRILNAALELENTAIAAYAGGAALLEGEARRTGRLFLEHERQHAGALTEAIRQLGGTPVKAKSADEYRRSFPRLESQEDVLKFAVDLENTAVAAYVDAIPKLSDPGLRQTAAAINTNEAEHITVLRAVLGEEDVVPDAFVSGEGRI